MLKTKTSKREVAHLKTYSTAKDPALRGRERDLHSTLPSMRKGRSKKSVNLIKCIMKKSLRQIKEKQILSKMMFSQIQM